MSSGIWKAPLIDGGVSTKCAPPKPVAANMPEAHTVIDAGADLVLGHGPHVMRGMEIYKGHLIVYSMGNFCTYGWFGLAEETALTSVFEINLAPDGRFVGGRCIRASI